MKDQELTRLISVNRAPCVCPFCEEGRFIKRLQVLLPEAEANELGDWYNALRDSQEDRDMRESGAESPRGDYYMSEQESKRSHFKAIMRGLFAAHNNPANREPCTDCDEHGYLYTVKRRKVPCSVCYGEGTRLRSDVDILGSIGGGAIGGLSSKNSEVIIP